MTDLAKDIAAYNQIRESLERDSPGKIAMMHEGKFVAVYNDRADAYDIGCEKYGLGGFSLKRIGEAPRSLGAAVSYASPVPVE